jgi:peptidoglycan/LPS O-acetylase OafA/YrhL
MGDTQNPDRLAMKLKYLPCLDGIRACAFVLVFFAHAGAGSEVPGGLGVTIFFFLSGYLITTLLRVEWSETGHISLRNFYIRRAIRILPPLYLVLAIGWALDFLHVPAHQANGFGLASVLFYFYNYASLAHLRVGIPAGLGVVWSLMIEEHFYFLFPVLYLSLRKRAASVRSTVALLSVICLIVLLWRFILIYGLHTSTAGLGWTYQATDARFDSILWGAILAVGANPWCGDKIDFLERKKGWFAAFGLLMLLLSLTIREPHFRETLRYTWQGLALLPIFYYVVANPCKWQTRWLSWKPLRWLGWVSYTMYLTHFLALQIVWAYTTWHPVLTGVVVAAICGVFSELVRRTIENPLRRMKRRTHLEVAVSN